MRWPIPAGLLGLALLASPAPARADEPLYLCAKVAADAKLTIQFTPDLTLHDLGVWVTSFTCKSVIYDAEAAARAPKLTLIAPSAVTPKQAVQLFLETVGKAGLAVTEKPDTFVITLDAATRRRCPAPPPPRPGFGAGACVRTPADTKLSLSFKPDVTLADLALWVGGFTCKRVSFDPKIAPQSLATTLIVPTKVTPKQATRLFIDAVESTGLVVTEKADAFDVKPGPRWAHCAATAQAPSGPSAPPGPSGPGPSGPSGSPGSGPPAPPDVDVDAIINAGVVEIDETHYEVKRTVIDEFRQNPMAFLKHARVVPAMKNGQFDGFKLYAIRPSSAAARIGLQNGDTLQTINGKRLGSVEDALDAFSGLARATRIELGLIRRGKPLTLTLTIKK